MRSLSTAEYKVTLFTLYYAVDKDRRVETSCIIFELLLCVLLWNDFAVPLEYCIHLYQIKYHQYVSIYINAPPSLIHSLTHP